MYQVLPNKLRSSTSSSTTEAESAKVVLVDSDGEEIAMEDEDEEVEDGSSSVHDDGGGRFYGFGDDGGCGGCSGGGGGRDHEVAASLLLLAGHPNSLLSLCRSIFLFYTSSILPPAVANCYTSQSAEKYFCRGLTPFPFFCLCSLLALLSLCFGISASHDLFPSSLPSEMNAPHFCIFH